MKIRPIKFTDEQWSIIQRLAEASGMTASDFVRDAAGRSAKAKGQDWPDSPTWGGIRKTDR